MRILDVGCKSKRQAAPATGQLPGKSERLVIGAAYRS
jgi:hypothetical protein